MRRAIFVLCLFAPGCIEEVYPPDLAWCEDELSVDKLPEVPTYAETVGPLLQSRCTRCHREGGIGTFAIESYDDAVAHKDAIRRAVVERTMPPWMPAKCCTDYEQDFSLTQEQIDLIASWVDGGTPRGEPGISPAEEPGFGLGPVTLTLDMAEEYERNPPPGTNDDTRCFMLDWPEDETKYVTGFRFVPGNAAVVHHAVVLVAGPDLVPTYEYYAQQDEAYGWSCPGGLVSGYGYLGGWSPGWEGQKTPDGHGHRVDPGSKVVVSIHYSAPARAEQDLPDRSRIELVTVDEVDHEIQAISVFNALWPWGGMPIPAGEKDVKYNVMYDPTDVVGYGQPLTLLSVNLHMHERGKSGMIGILRKDGTEECLLQIDRYEHEWQGDYIFKEPKVLEPDDRLYLECHFDNSEDNQRVVFGEKEAPRDLNWAEDGEMCVGFVAATK